MTETRTLVLIPARMAATRLPGKPLLDIAGVPMIVHVVRSAEAGCDLIVDELGRFGTGQRVWVALRPEKIRLSKEPIAGNRYNQVKGMVWELGYLGNRSTYRIKTATGKVVTVFSQNERRTSEWTIDWSDEVFVSWGADAAVLLHS